MTFSKESKYSKYVSGYSFLSYITAKIFRIDVLQSH